MNLVKKRLKNIRLGSGKTHGQLELPKAAPLVYPYLDCAAARAMDGKEREAEGTREKMKSAGAWVQDYMARKAQASYPKTPGSSLAVPESGRKEFVARFNDPNHPVNYGKLTSVLTGGLMGNKPCLLNGLRLPSGNHKTPRELLEKTPGIVKKVLQQDVLYLLIVSMPTEEELKQSIAQLEHLMQQSGQCLPRQPSH
ncbi:hypothetical protein BDV40DRAFT_302011 [Aspergillus tamarii]|uniref:Uncharacterized protein n=1 Tax=Aspergillus tamarii TaxID=41984 RepID=A0A5N6UQ83_ASPTM|nr:hypothetical protein BDV40DRAFT_302011 [Aspergillus tamarii]